LAQTQSSAKVNNWFYPVIHVFMDSDTLSVHLVARLRRARYNRPILGAKITGCHFRKTLVAGLTRMTHLICDLIPQMDVWSPDHQVDPLERIKRLDGEKGVSNNHTVASVEVKGNLRFPLDISYHGCPLSASQL
jgi:hypothetical protein